MQASPEALLRRRQLEQVLTGALRIHEEESKMAMPVSPVLSALSDRSTRVFSPERLPALVSPPLASPVMSTSQVLASNDRLLIAAHRQQTLQGAKLHLQRQRVAQDLEHIFKLRTALRLPTLMESLMPTQNMRVAHTIPVPRLAPKMRIAPTWVPKSHMPPRIMPSFRHTPSPLRAEQALHLLGTTLRHKHEDYIDVNAWQISESSANRKVNMNRFPAKLHQLLEDAHHQGMDDVVSFYDHGRAFCVHNMTRFTQELMPKYFKQSKWNSFARQLSLYGFQRLGGGKSPLHSNCSGGCYYHELFLRNRLDLTEYMGRVGVPGPTDRRKLRSIHAHLPKKEPPFASLPKMTEYSNKVTGESSYVVSPQGEEEDKK